MNHCKTCNIDFIGKCCSNCGKPVQLKRINGQYIINEIRSVLNFDKGILFTIRELVLRPGDSIKEFLHEDRNQLVKPIIFLVFSTLILALVRQNFEVNSGVSKDLFDNLNPGVKLVFEWFEKNNGLGNILTGVFIGFVSKLFFRKSDFNMYEIFILSFFISGIVNLIFAFYWITESLLGFYNGEIGLLLGLVYSSWAIGNFFKKNKFLSYFKGFLAYFLGTAASYIFIVSVGNLINIFIKNSS